MATKNKSKTTKERTKKQQQKFELENPKGYAGVRDYGQKRKFGGVYYTKTGNFLAKKDAEKMKEAQKDRYYIRLIEVRKGYFDVFTRTKSKYRNKSSKKLTIWQKIKKWYQD